MKRPHRPMALLALLALLSLTLAALAPPVQAQTDAGRIVFVMDRDNTGNGDIYVINPDGSGLTQITNHPAHDSDPAWSPDGTKIAFSSYRANPESADIYVMNADGSGVTRLTTSGGRQPAWSPDGQRIVFTGPGQTGFISSFLYVMNADGSNLARLDIGVMPEQEYGSYFLLSHPAWSPDGSRMAFAAAIGDQLVSIAPPIWIGTVTGNTFQGGEVGIYGHSPTWAADGSRIALSQNNFGSDFDFETMMSDIYVANPNGFDTKQVTYELSAIEPTWSPDGQRLAFTNEQGMYIINVDGSGLQQLMTTSYLPDWSRAAGQPPPPSDALCFDETGYCIAGRIRKYWEENGGLPVFGFPITVQREEMIEGRPFQVQWFERNRLELHPELARPYDVLLGRLGVDRLVQRGYDWQAVPTETPQAGCRFFAETGRNVCGDILAAWRANGLDLDGRRGFTESENLALFGLPVTGLITERLGDGREYQVQYFERVRFELHPENAPPYHVLLGLLGHEVNQ